MKYKAEQIMPIRAKDFGKQAKYTTTEMMTDFYIIYDDFVDTISKAFIHTLSPKTWIIPVENTPDELCPLQHPKYKPGETGEYLIHYSDIDKWEVAYWGNVSQHWYRGDDHDLKTFNIDLFIPYKLESEKYYSLSDIQKEFFPNSTLEELFHEAEVGLGDLKREYDMQKSGLEIKPCPLCEDKHIELLKSRIMFDGCAGDYWRYQCENCGVTTEGCLNVEGASTLWNALPR